MIEVISGSVGGEIASFLSTCFKCPVSLGMTKATVHSHIILSIAKPAEPSIPFVFSR